MSEIRKALEKENVSEEKIKEVLNTLGINESKRWEPEFEEEYWTVGNDCGVCKSVWLRDDFDRQFKLTGNVFKTFREAEHHRDKINFLAQMKIDFEDNSDEIDWDDEGQKKYYIYVFRGNDELRTSADYALQTSGALYTTNEEWLEQYISENETEIKKYCFGIE